MSAMSLIFWLNESKSLVDDYFSGNVQFTIAQQINVASIYCPSFRRVTGKIFCWAPMFKRKKITNPSTQWAAVSTQSPRRGTCPEGRRCRSQCGSLRPPSQISEVGLHQISFFFYLNLTFCIHSPRAAVARAKMQIVWIMIANLRERLWFIKCIVKPLFISSLLD